MKVEFYQSNGFAGITKSCSLDEQKLKPNIKKDLEHLIKTHKNQPSFNRDTFQYEIIIQKENQKPVSIILDESKVPENIKPLISFLQNQSVACV